MWLILLRFNVKSSALPAPALTPFLPHPMLLTLDIGNTRAKLVSFLDGRPRPEAVCAVAELPAALARIGARCPSIEAVHWCSVGADIATVEHMLSRTGWASRRLVPSAEVNGVHLDYRTPQTLGADRLAAVLGARCLQPTGHLLVMTPARASPSTCCWPMGTTWAATSAQVSTCVWPPCMPTPRAFRKSMPEANCLCSGSTPRRPCAAVCCAALPSKSRAMSGVCAKNMAQLLLF